MGDRFDALRREMQRQIDEGIRPSIQVAVDLRGELVFDETIGGGATPSSNYLLFSSTKPLIAVALLQLIEEGRAKLQDRVRAYIPEFGVRGKQSCTIAHLLTHRGGFPDSGQRMRSLSRVSRDWQAALAAVCEMDAQWEPGKDHGYHPSSSWFIVGELIQRLRDRPLWDVLRERVLEPAGFDADGFSLGNPEVLSEPALQLTTRAERGTARDADWWNDPATHRAVIPGGSGVSRANQLVRFYRAMLDLGRGRNGRLLSERMVRTASFPHVVGSIDRTFLVDVPWGLGFRIRHPLTPIDDFGNSATPGAFGHGGHFLVNTAWADPAKDIAACILSNGLTAPRTGTKAVVALSQAIHDALS
ncbi:MAG TPA: serine hydrolase domain-containing protein [Myxococcota bacterium]|nr:serine hydrolase domain-containing protein [Myxococcota bacterium]